jgi:hypothetical protein
VVAETRRPGAAILVRLSPEQREVIRRAVPAGSLNATIVQLLLDHVRGLESSGGLLPVAEEDTTTTAA